MARPLRLQFSGTLYRVTARSNERKLIFRDERDRRRRSGSTSASTCLPTRRQAFPPSGRGVRDARAARPSGRMTEKPLTLGGALVICYSTAQEGLVNGCSL
jgi:hypothetical protein